MNNRYVQKTSEQAKKKKDKVAQKHDILNYADGKVGIGWTDKAAWFMRT